MPYAVKTRVPVSQSRTEIEQLLEKHKAKQFGTAVDYDANQARVQFRLQDRIVRFLIGLPDRKKYGQGIRWDQQERQRWRALLLVIKAKLESVENGIETLEEAFLAEIVMPGDQTVAELLTQVIAESYRTGRQLLLPPGNG